MITEQQRISLNADFPRELVRTRKGGGNKTLSYAEGWEVIDTLNTILGAGEWGYECVAEMVVSQERPSDKGVRWHVTFTSRCVLTVRDCPPIADYGAGHGIDADFGAAIESAIKEAATDSLKRCAKSLGRRLGLALYDKTQAHIAEAEPPPPPQPQPGVGRDMIAAVYEAKTAEQLEAVKANIRSSWATVPEAERGAVTAAVKAWRVPGG